MFDYMENFYFKLRRRLFPTKPVRIYNIDGFTMDMGENHNLSVFQQEFAMYDRFIPFLAELADCTHGGDICPLRMYAIH